MTTFRTASPPEPPADWLERLQDYAQVRSLINGDSVCIGEGDSAAHRILEFIGHDPVVAEAWSTFNAGRPKL